MDEFRIVVDDLRDFFFFVGVLPKRCVFVINEVIFVNFCLKKACARHVGSLSVSSDDTIGRKGVDCKFLELYGLQLTQLKH